MKIYTKTGDDGTTGLIGGRRVSKAELRLDVYGTVDELCAVLGWAGVSAGDEWVAPIRDVQNDLFVIGSHLATPVDQPPGRTPWLPVIEPTMVARLEGQIDSADAQLPKLQNFILPGGCELAGRLHVARTVCRRAERLLVQLSQTERIEPLILTYLNRLSDWLFVQARLANHRSGTLDIPWLARKE